MRDDGLLSQIHPKPVVGLGLLPRPHLLSGEDSGNRREAAGDIESA